MPQPGQPACVHATWHTGHSAAPTSTPPSAALSTSWPTSLSRWNACIATCCTSRIGRMAGTPHVAEDVEAIASLQTQHVAQQQAEDEVKALLTDTITDMRAAATRRACITSHHITPHITSHHPRGKRARAAAGPARRCVNAAQCSHGCERGCGGPVAVRA